MKSRQRHFLNIIIPESLFNSYLFGDYDRDMKEITTKYFRHKYTISTTYYYGSWVLSVTPKYQHYTTPNDLIVFDKIVRAIMTTLGHEPIKDERKPTTIASGINGIEWKIEF